MSKVLTVIGATGNQGGSVIRTVLNHKLLSQQYRIRAVTRDQTKPAALALKNKGVQIVQADLMKKETLREAIEGSNIVFANTDFWVNGSKEAEVLQGKNIADVVAECGVPFMIWSTLPYASKMTGGKVTSVAHFDSKGEVEEYIRSLGIPASYFVPAFYLQNVKHFMKETNEGLLRLSYTFPSNTPIPVLDPVADTGKFVAALLLHQKQMIGKWILGASGWYTPDDMVTAVAQASGKKVFYQQISDEMLQQILPGTMGVEICGNFELIKDWKYYGLDAEERLDESLKLLDERPITLEQWVQQNGPWV